MHSKLLLASTFGAAAAFQAPAASKATSSLQAMYNPSSFDDVQSLPGILNPTGFFDPAGLSNDVSASELKRYREAELTHGRVAMLASLGFVVAESFHPMYGGKINVPSVIAWQETPLQDWMPLVGLVIMIHELTSVFTFNSPFGGEIFSIRSDYASGDLGWDPLGLKPTDAAALKEMQTKEINNGRLAMIAVAGMIGQELAQGSKLF